MEGLQIPSVRCVVFFGTFVICRLPVLVTCPRCKRHAQVAVEATVADKTVVLTVLLIFLLIVLDDDDCHCKGLPYWCEDAALSALCFLEP